MKAKLSNNELVPTTLLLPVARWPLLLSAFCSRITAAIACPNAAHCWLRLWRRAGAMRPAG